MKLAKFSWWISVVGLFVWPFAVVAVVGGLTARHLDPECEWRPAVGLGLFGVVVGLAAMLALVVMGAL